MRHSDAQIRGLMSNVKEFLVRKIKTQSLRPFTELGRYSNLGILLKKSGAAVVCVFGANWTDPLARRDRSHSLSSAGEIATSARSAAIDPTPRRRVRF